MEENRTPPDLSDIPGYNDLTPEHQEQLRSMAENMSARTLPDELISSGLRSTARLLRDQEKEQAPRIQSDEVRRFLEANRGEPVARRSRAIPRRETKVQTRERLQDQLTRLLSKANTATRRHEMLRVRRELLALDQGYIRRVLGQEGANACNEINAWLIEAATKLNGR